MDCPLPGSDEVAAVITPGARPKRGKTERGTGHDDDEAASSLSCAITNKKQKTAASADHRSYWSAGHSAGPAAGLTITDFRSGHVYEGTGCGDSPDSSCPDDDEVDPFPSCDSLPHASCSSSGYRPDPTADSEFDNLSKPADLQQWLSMFQLWTNTERMAALESLVTNGNCDGQQIRFLLSLIEPQLQRDFVSLLPKELALYVLSFLDPKDLLQAAQTCRYWRILCEDNLLWREKCRDEGLLQDQETIVDLFRKRSAKRSSSSSKSLQSHSAPGHSSAQQETTDPAPPTSSEYKLGFLRQKSIEYNWRYGRFPSDPEASGTSPPAAGRKGRYLRPIQQLKGHDDHVITCLQFNPTSK